MKKDIFALASLSLLASLPLQGDYAPNSSCVVCPAPALEESCCPYVDPCEEHLFVERCQFFINTEFLYWTVNEEPLEYAARMNQSTSALQTVAIGDYKIADYDFCPGFRVAMGWYNEPKFWEVTGQYTWLYDRGSDHANAPSESDRFLSPTWDTYSVGPFREASSSLHLHYQVGDLFAARVFDPNPHLRMRLYGGITSAFLKQTWNVRYTDFQDQFEKIQNMWRFWGTGIRMGTTVDWYWHLFYFTGRVSIASLVGTYKNEAEQITSFQQVVGDVTYKKTRFTFNGQFLLGASYLWICECWSAEIFAGYEANVWLNLQEIIKSQLSFAEAAKQTQHSSGLLGLHGLTARFTVGF